MTAHRRFLNPKNIYYPTPPKKKKLPYTRLKLSPDEIAKVHASDASSQGERKPPGVSTLDKNIVDNVLNTRHVQSLRERLDEMKYTKEFITIEKFGELCEECGCTDKKPEEYVEIMKNAGMVIQIEDYVYWRSVST